MKNLRTELNNTNDENTDKKLIISDVISRLNKLPRYDMGYTGLQCGGEHLNGNNDWAKWSEIRKLIDSLNINDL